jgi:hypothetical protein
MEHSFPIFLCAFPYYIRWYFCCVRTKSLVTNLFTLTGLNVTTIMVRIKQIIFILIMVDKSKQRRQDIVGVATRCTVIEAQKVNQS